MDPFMELQGHLRADEQLLWHGVPDQRVWLAPADAFMIPFSVAFCAFTVFWVHSAGAGGGGTFAEVIGIPFAFFGLYYLVGRFAYKWFRKGRTVYAITSQRAVIAYRQSFSDIPLKDQPVTVRRARDGRHASVVFDGTATAPVRRAGFPARYRTTPVPLYANTGMDLILARGAGLPFAFYDVADPDAMLAALDQARTRLG